MKKITLLILFTVCWYLKSHSQFNKQWLVSGGFQFSNSNQKSTVTITNSNTSYVRNGNYYNFGLNAEIGYFVLKNVSVSYNLIYQIWNQGGFINGRSNVQSLRNCLFINYFIPLNENTFFNIGGAPFYEKSRIKTDTYELDNINHGMIMTTGFNFLITKNDLIGVNIYRAFDALPQDHLPKSGLLLSYKHLLNKTEN